LVVLAMSDDAPFRLIVLDIPEFATGRTSTDWMGDVPNVENMTRAAGETATSVSRYLLDPAETAPKPQLRIALGNQKIDLVGTRDEAVVLVTTLYSVNGRQALADLRAAISQGTPIGLVVSPSQYPVMDEGAEASFYTSAIVPLLSQMTSMFDAALTDLAKQVADDLVQLEDAAVQKLLDALNLALSRVEKDRNDLIGGDDNHLRRDDKGQLLDRCKKLIATCTQLADLDAQISQVNELIAAVETVGAVILPPQLATTETPEERAKRAGRLAQMAAEALADASGKARGDNKLSRLLAAALSAAADALANVAQQIGELRDRLFALVRSRALLLQSARADFALIELLSSELGNVGTIDEEAVTAAYSRAELSFRQTHERLKAAVDAGQMSVLRGSTKVLEPGFATPFATRDVPFLSGTDFLTTTTPEQTLTLGIATAGREGRSTLWNQPELIQAALAGLSERSFAEIGWGEVRLAQGREHPVLEMVGELVVQLTLRAVVGYFTAGLSEAGFLAHDVTSGLLDAFHNYANYSRDKDLQRAAQVCQQGLLTADPSLLPTVLSAIGAISSAAHFSKFAHTLSGAKGGAAAIAKLASIAEALDAGAFGVMGLQISAAFIASAAQATQSQQ
jgi:hypothetical protein